jgi:hypothetical protein
MFALLRRILIGFVLARLVRRFMAGNRGGGARR